MSGFPITSLKADGPETTLGSHSTPERSMSASFHDERIGRFNDAVKSCSSLGGVAPIVLVKRPIKGQIKTGANLMNGQKTRSAPLQERLLSGHTTPTPPIEERFYYNCESLSGGNSLHCPQFPSISGGNSSRVHWFLRRRLTNRIIWTDGGKRSSSVSTTVSSVGAITPRNL
jgi:hypothetical protein